VQRSYGLDLHSPYASAPLFQRTGGAYDDYHTITGHALAPPGGGVVGQPLRRLWRRDIAGGAQVEQPWRFPGQYLDAESGLHYTLRRCYDADTGRYISEDPLRFESSSNFCSYAENPPQNHVDPTGEVAFLAPAAWA